MGSLTQVLIPGLMEKLKSIEVLNELLLGKQTLAEKVTSHENSVSFNFNADNYHTQAVKWQLFGAMQLIKAMQPRYFPGRRVVPHSSVRCIHSLIQGFQASTLWECHSHLQMEWAHHRFAQEHPLLYHSIPTQIWISTIRGIKYWAIYFQRRKNRRVNSRKWWGWAPTSKAGKIYASVRTIKILKAVSEKPIKNEKWMSITNMYSFLLVTMLIPKN